MHKLTCRVLGLLGFAFFFMTATAANLPSSAGFKQVQSLLAAQRYVSGNFTQIRKVTLLRAPLVSTGTFRLSEKSGLIWHTQHPIKSTLTLSATKLTQQIEGGPVTVFTQAKQPIVFAFTKVFLSVFQGNTSELLKYFTVTFTGDKHDWHMRCVPVMSPLDKAIRQITLTGANTVKQVIIADSKGNTQTIRFTQVQVR